MSRSIQQRAAARQGTLFLLLAAVLITALCAYVLFPPKLARSRDTNVAAPSPQAAAPLPDKSIAVLPFQNLSQDQENAFFADGVPP